MDVLPTGSRPSQRTLPDDPSTTAHPGREPSGGPWGRLLAAAALLGAAYLVRRLGPNGTGSGAGDATTVDGTSGRRTRTESPSDDDSNGRFVRLAAAVVAASAVGYLARRWQG